MYRYIILMYLILITLKLPHAFLRFLGLDCNFPRESHLDYSPILASLNLDSLEIRRTKLDLNVLYESLNNNVDCPEYLHKLNFHVPGLATISNTSFYFALNILFNRF